MSGWEVTMVKVNHWRVAALVLIAVVAGMGYSLWVLLVPTEESRMDSSTGPLAIQTEIKGETGDDTDEAPYVVGLLPDWPSTELSVPETPPKLEFKHDYLFERDWHTRHGPYWDQALERFKGKPNIKYLEIGLFEGASFFWVLETILTDPSAHATGIDPFFREYSKIRNYGDNFFDNLKMSQEEDRSTIITGFSQVELKN